MGKRERASLKEQRRRQAGTRSRWPLFVALGIVLIAVVLLTQLGQRSRDTAEKAPSFSLEATGNRTVSLADYLGRTNLLVYFYEHAG